MREPLKRLFLLCWVFIIIASVLKYLNIYSFELYASTNWFKEICVYLDNNVIVYHLVAYLFSLLTAYLIYASILDKQKLLSLKLFISLSFIILLKNIFLHFEYVIPFYIASIIFNITPLLFGAKIFRLASVMFIDVLFQAYSMSFVREIPLATLSESTITMYLFSIDYYTMLFALYLYSKMKGDNLCILDFGLWDCLLTNFKQNLKLLRTRNKLNVMLSTLRNWKIELHTLLNKVKEDFVCFRFFLKYTIFFPSLALIPIITYTLLVNKALEFLFFMAAYGFLRHSFSKTFHADNIPNIKTQHVSIVCVILSGLLFYMSIRHVLPFSSSIFSTIIVAFIADSILYLAKDYIDLYLFKIKHMEFDIDTCSREDLIERCRLKNLSSDETELVVRMFYDKANLQQLANELVIEYQSMRTKKYRLRKKLK